MGAGIDWSFLHYPWGAVFALLWAYLIVVLYVLSESKPALRRLYGNFSCILCLAVCTCMCILEGCGANGFHNTLIFNAVFFCLCSAVALSAADDIRFWLRKNSRSPGRLLAHTGLALLLVVCMCGTADKQRVRVVASADKPVSEGVMADGTAVQLPFCLTLKEFSIDEYPSRLHFAKDGKTLYSCSSCDTASSVEVDGHVFRILKFYDSACRLPDGRFRPLVHVGASPAALVCADGKDSAWVSCGSFVFSSTSLQLVDGLEVMMPQPAARCYKSVLLKDSGPSEITVNHPLSSGSWKIYQAGYNTVRGKWSTTSIFECVRDPWALPKTAVWLTLLVSGVFMVFRGIRYLPHRQHLAFVLLLSLAFTYLIIFRHNLQKDLPPALQSPWYVPHVAVYIIGYSSLAIATVLAIVQLLKNTSDKAFYSFVRIGWGLLVMGMAMGALWAKQAWGDFWTWDPKETWAAATIFGWTLVLHLRKEGKARYILAIFSFLLLQMCWWGVNLLPSSSLHIYQY